MDPMLKMFGVASRGMAFVAKESIYNQFHSDLVTPLADSIVAPGTTVHVFYATKMGEQYEECYSRHFKNPDIRRHDLQHEELLACQPGLGGGGAALRSVRWVGWVPVNSRGKASSWPYRG
jgi:hypothetical protein